MLFFFYNEDKPNTLKFNAVAEISKDGLVSVYVKKTYISFQERTPKPLRFLGISSQGLSYADIDINNGKGNQKAIRPMIAICYESIYAKGLINQMGKGLEQINFMFSNEYFMNNSTGLNQNFKIAQLKSIELRKPIARTSNLGISSFINAQGRVLYKNESILFLMLYISLQLIVIEHYILYMGII